MADENPTTEPSNDELAAGATSSGPDLSKLTKAQLAERLQDANLRYEEVVAQIEHERRRGPRRSPPEVAFAITALVELHRETASAMPGVSTIRGRAVATTAPRYLEAARALGDDLVDSILGPSKPEAKPAR